MRKRTKKSMKQQILEFFQGRGNEGATADEAVTFFGAKHYSSVTARITEMVNSFAPQLFTTGRVRKTRRGGYGAVLITKQAQPFNSLFN